MRISLLLALCILLLGWVFLGRARESLDRAERHHEVLLEQAAALEIEGAGTRTPAKDCAAKVSDRERTRHESEVRVLAARLIGYAREARERERRGEGDDPEAQAKVLELLSGLGDLSVGQLELLVSELQACEEMDATDRKTMIGAALLTLIDEDPEAALELCVKVSADSRLGSMGDFLSSKSLAKWAAEDPQEALAWIDEHRDSHPDLADDRALRGAIAGVVHADPVLALQLAGDQDEALRSESVQALVESVATGEARDALWDELDGADPGLRAEFLVATAQRLGEGDFEEAVDWIERRGFSDGEEAEIAAHLTLRQRLDDAGSWLEWTGERLEGAELERVTGTHMERWVETDTRAAGEWLTELPDDSPVRVEAVATYARIVAPYDAVAAAQWAETLPPGEQRENLIKQVEQSWSELDPEAAMIWAKGVAGPFSQ